MNIFIFFLFFYANASDLPKENLSLINAKIDISSDKLKKINSNCEKVCLETYEVKENLSLSQLITLKPGAIIIVNKDIRRVVSITTPTGLIIGDEDYLSPEEMKNDTSYDYKWRPTILIPKRDVRYVKKNEYSDLIFKASQKIELYKDSMKLKKVILAADGYTTSNVSDCSSHETACYINIPVKKDSVLKFYEKSVWNLISELTLSKDFSFDGLKVPKDTTVFFNRYGLVERLKLAKAATIQNRDFSENEIVEIKPIYTYQVPLPQPSNKISETSYSDFNCKKNWNYSRTDNVEENMFYTAGCKFLLTSDSSYDGISLKKGCVVFTQEGSPNIRGFRCPMRIEYAGHYFDKNAAVIFGEKFLGYYMPKGTPKACVSGKNLKFMTGHFYNGYCVSFNKEREPEYIWSENNVTVGDRTYFGPVLLKVEDTSLFLVSDKSSSDRPTFDNIKDSYFPLCGKNGKIKLYDGPSLKKSIYSLPRCTQVDFNILGKNISDFDVLEIKKDIWKIQVRTPRWPETEYKGPPYLKTFWIKATKDLSTPATIKIGSTEVRSPFTPNGDPDSYSRVWFADENYIYVQSSPDSGCFSQDHEIYKIPRPKDLKIENLPAKITPQYQIKADMCST